MRTASIRLLALALAFGCSSSEGEPGGAGGNASSSGSGGSMSNSSGAVGQPVDGTASGGTAASKGGAGSGGLVTGGSTEGGASGSGGGGARAGAGGRANGGGSSGSSGSSGCVQNLTCKLSPPPSTGDIYQDCVDRINQFLTQCACLPALTRRMDGEACANQMAEYDASKDSPHAGTIANICQPGGSQNECPGYASNTQVIGLCMQQMWDEGPPPSSTCTGSCYQEHGHFINMTDKDVTKVACGFHTTSSGKVWAVQNFSR